ncbi:MAG: LTA synthase family protein [Flavobacteriales bacterium]
MIPMKTSLFPILPYLCAMIHLRRTLLMIPKLLLFWLLVFDLQRILFSIHNWEKLESISMLEWMGAFVHSIRLDLATGALLSFLPLLLLIIHYLKPSKWSKVGFYTVVFLEVMLCAFVHGGEINAYPEWNHKLTTRVFTHLLNPDEVVRTADLSMTVWFIVYASIELYLGYKLMKLLFKPGTEQHEWKWFLRVPAGIAILAISGLSFIVIGRGGTQQIPINIDSAYYTKDYVANDLSVNSVYFFAKSFMLYNRSEIGAMFPLIPETKCKKFLHDFYNYPEKHNNFILSNTRPNIVFLIMESWTANAIVSITGEEGNTPLFDQLTKQGLLFTRLYATGGTSEIGNSSIFSGYPALPEISISMQPDKHRKLPSLNQDLKKWGYSSHYLFSGDLKYGNIGGYFMDHGFDVVEDEDDFPKNLRKGKLNYFDEDLYDILIKKIDKTKGPFMHCAFTGSTHSPYDHPKNGIKKWYGREADFMTSMGYADKCLNDFLLKCRKKPWYENTIFIIVADHGHGSPKLENPNLAGYFHIPMLIFGEPLKKEFKGKRIETLGSQADIARTLLYQMGGEYRKYRWSKDLLNPNCPQFALHTINRGYGWVTEKGNFSINMDANSYPENTYKLPELRTQRNICHSYMSLIYDEYKEL